MKRLNSNNQNLGTIKYAMLFCSENPMTIYILCKGEYRGECTRQIRHYKKLGFEINYCEEISADFDMTITKYNDETQDQIFVH